MSRIIWVTIGMLALACYSTASQAAVTSLTVTGCTVSKSTGATTLSGTIVCTVNDSVEVDAMVIQVSKPRLAEGFGFVDLTCSGGTDAWTAPITLFMGSTPTQPGAGVGSANAFDSTDNSGIAPPGRKIVCKPVP